MIDYGIGAFSKSDSALSAGTTMKTRVKFNKTFDRNPVVVVSWSELNANSYFDYLTIDSLKMIDYGIGAFSKSDSALSAGTTMKTRVKFNKTFDRNPVVVVSWSELNANSYFDYLTIDRLTVDGDGFEAITRTKNANAWRDTWYFSWIAIST